jgi:hypothetical protein
VNDAIDAAMSHLEYLSNLQSGEVHLMELHSRSLHQIGTFYLPQKKLAQFLSTSLEGFARIKSVLSVPVVI